MGLDDVLGCNPGAALETSAALPPEDPRSAYGFLAREVPYNRRRGWCCHSTPSPLPLISRGGPYEWQKMTVQNGICRPHLRCCLRRSSTRRGPAGSGWSRAPVESVPRCTPALPGLRGAAAVLFHRVKRHKTVHDDTALLPRQVRTAEGLRLPLYGAFGLCGPEWVGYEHMVRIFP